MGKEITSKAISSYRIMIILTTLHLLLLCAPSLLAQGVQQCRSCCPEVEAPVPETVACDTLDSHLEMMKEAIEGAGCDDSSQLESEEVCHAITMKAIPPCMLMEGTNKQAKCLADAAQDIEEELGIGEEAGAEVVVRCKCDAFKKISEALSSVRNMMCPPSDSDRNPRTYYGYGANTLWVQYILCQQESIPSLACWLFTSGWNQAEFGQYYLYDNLLNSEEGGFLDGDLLPILALGGGLNLGGGSYAPAHAHSGHPVYRRSACKKGDEGCVEASRKRRSDCKKGEEGCEEQSRKRRRSECKDDEVETENGCRKRRSVSDCKKGDEGCEKESRKRRSDCKKGEEGCEESSRKRRSDCKNGEEGCEELSRKRRSDCKGEEGCEEPSRKRRSDCTKGEDGCEEPQPSRKRRSEEKPKCNEGYVLAPRGCIKRKRCSVKCEDGVGVVG